MTRSLIEKALNERMSGDQRRTLRSLIKRQPDRKWGVVDVAEGIAWLVAFEPEVHRFADREGYLWLTFERALEQSEALDG